jgi:hypothetical protein
MDADGFLEAVRDERATQLHRLGSDKYLIAATGADLAEGPVLRSVAREAASGRETFESWTESEDGPAAEAFAVAAETERDHLDRIRERLDADDEDIGNIPPDGAVHDAFGAAETTAGRAGALVGRALVRDRTLLQVVNFFVNEGDSGGADFARELRSDAGDQRDAGADLLERVCEGADDRERAQAAAERGIGAAYEAYADALEAMGVDPKPVC